MTEFVGHGDAALEYHIAIRHEQDGSWTAAIEKLGMRTNAATAIEARSTAHFQWLHP
jgi:hypothetical protein